MSTSISFSILIKEAFDKWRKKWTKIKQHEMSLDNNNDVGHDRQHSGQADSLARSMHPACRHTWVTSSRIQFSRTRTGTSKGTRCGDGVTGVMGNAKKEVVVRRAAVPQQQVARFGAHLDPLAAVVGEPLHTGVRKAVPLVGPCWDLLLPCHLLVELRRERMRALADDQSAIIRSVRKQVHQALQAAEARLERVLVLVRPRLVGRQVLAVGETKVDGIKRDDQVFGAQELFKRSYHAGLRADLPRPVLVRHGVVEAHALLRDGGQLVLVHGGQVVAVVAELEALEPSVHLVGVLQRPFLGHRSFDNAVAIAKQVTVPSIEMSVGLGCRSGDRARLGDVVLENSRRNGCLNREHPEMWTSSLLAMGWLGCQRSFDRKL
ncbi:hypothetical protein L1887_51329 [Cichorium endivia]|nr:hypothetical protein L1887_51329 [Cichorium endivia]